MKEIVFTADNWVKFVDDLNAPIVSANKTTDKFTGPLALNWQWSVRQQLNLHHKNGRLGIDVFPDIPATYVGQKAIHVNYEAIE